MRTKIDFIAPPFSGHLNPLIELARPLLHHEKYQIRFITGPQKVDLLQSLGFEALPLLAGRPDAIERIANTAQPVKSNPWSLFKQLQENLAILPVLKEEVRELVLANRTDVVVADFTAVPAGIVCDEQAIPWITVIPTPFAIETFSGTPSYLGGYLHSTSVAARIRDFLGRKFVHLFKLTMGVLCSKELQRLNFRIYRADGTENAYSPYAILGLGMTELEFPRDWPPTFKLIGPCCASPEKELKLDIPFEKYHGAVLVTLGTHLEWAKHNLIAKIQRLGERFGDTLFVLSLGRPQNQRRDPVYCRDNILVYEYIPYSQYMEPFQVVVHHGGAGVVYNCIKFQKPCIVIPHDYDQFDFAARITQAGIGIRVKKIDSLAMVKALQTLLTGQGGGVAVNLQRINAALQQYNPPEALIHEIERLTKTSQK